MDKRYCTQCNFEQPIRSRHCQYCGKCSATYDHHCSWMGNCIAEKNKFLFLCFCFFQFIEVSLAIIKAFDILVNDKKNIITIIICIFSILITTFFFLLVGSLVLYHVYLISANLTTWEHRSWHKITYLKDYSKKFGSPFNLGMINNYKFFIKAITNSDPRDWKAEKLWIYKQEMKK